MKVVIAWGDEGSAIVFAYFAYGVAYFFTAPEYVILGYFACLSLLTALLDFD